MPTEPRMNAGCIDTKNIKIKNQTKEVTAPEIVSMSLL